MYFLILSALFNFKLCPFLYAREFLISEIRYWSSQFFQGCKYEHFSWLPCERGSFFEELPINPNKVDFIFMLACKQVLPVQFDITLVKNIYPDFRFIVTNKSWKKYPNFFKVCIVIKWVQMLQVVIVCVSKNAGLVTAFKLSTPMARYYRA